MRNSMTEIGIVLLAAMMLTLAGCSEANGVDSAQAKVELAKQQLAQAKAQLAEAKSGPVDEEQTEPPADTAATESDASEPVATQPPESDTPADTATTNQVCANCGTISSIVPVQSQGGPPEFVGTILGGVAGAAIGHQIGGGSGKTIATIVGAIGGALAGHEVQQRMTGQQLFRVTVRMDAGGTSRITVPSAQQISEGMRVRVRGNNIVLM